MGVSDYQMMTSWPFGKSKNSWEFSHRIPFHHPSDLPSRDLKGHCPDLLVATWTSSSVRLPIFLKRRINHYDSINSPRKILTGSMKPLTLPGHGLHIPVWQALPQARPGDYRGDLGSEPLSEGRPCVEHP